METDIHRRLKKAGMDDVIATIILLETRQNALKAEIGDRDLKIEQLQKSLHNLTSVDGGIALRTLTSVSRGGAALLGSSPDTKNMKGKHNG